MTAKNRRHILCKQRIRKNRFVLVDLEDFLLSGVESAG